MAQKVCNLDCFHCHHPDCIREEPEKKRYPNYQSHREWCKKRYDRLKAEGACVRCGKYKATRGVLCIDCYTQRKKYDHRRNYKGLREYWRENGLCVCCGKETVLGKKTCQKHYAIFSRCIESNRNTESAKAYRDAVKKRQYRADTPRL